MLGCNIICLVSLLAYLGTVSCQNEEILNVCLDGKHHKTEPGPEAELFSACEPWKSRACCTNVTSHLAHQDGAGVGLYNFTYDHCPGKPMSDKCKRRFHENNCFYECSPNVGPWLVDESVHYRNQKFVDVPLSAEACQRWYDDCKEDFTCKDNWSKGWEWSDTNYCPSNMPCKKFSEFFATAQEFCEGIYPEDFKVVTASDKPGMVLWFDGVDNPNDEVARYYATELGLCCGAIRSNFSIAITALMLIAVAIFNN